MSSFDHDLLVVGASFGGAACAIAAASAGLRVCVVERKDDPGARLHTTGIIVREAAEHTLLGQAPAECLQRVERVRLYAPSLRDIALAAPGYYFLTTDTPVLMRWLAGQIPAHGAELRLGTSFTTAQRDGDGWQVPGIGRVRWLVGADGARSRVAERTGLAPVRNFLYGVEYEYAGASLPEPDALHCFVSRRFAPGYIGWVAQNPAGVQAGLALRHDASRARLPDIAGFLERIAPKVGLPVGRRPDAIRAGLIPCGGPVSPLARAGVMLTGDAAGIVSPVTAGGIHSAWAHGWAIGEAAAAHARGVGPSPEAVADAAAPRFRRKRLLRWAFDHFQMDWPFDLLLHSAPLRWAAEQVYFHRRGTPGH